MKKRRVRRKIWGDFIERYKSKDEIKRNKRLFLRREHYDNDNSTNVKHDKKGLYERKYWQINRNNRIFTNKKVLKYKL